MTTHPISIIQHQPLLPVPSSDQQLAIRQSKSYSQDFIPHLQQQDIKDLANAAEYLGRGQKGQRDGLLIRLLFDAALRVSEGCAIRPKDIVQSPDGGWYISILKGKGGRSRNVAVSPSLVARLQSYCYRQKILPDQKLFPITTARCWVILERCFQETGIQKPAGTGHCHVLRHSGALARLENTGNPKSVQDLLGHSSSAMTMRYMKTLTIQESLKVQQQMELW